MNDDIQCLNNYFVRSGGRGQVDQETSIKDDHSYSVPDIDPYIYRYFPHLKSREQAEVVKRFIPVKHRRPKKITFANEWELEQFAADLKDCSCPICISDIRKSRYYIMPSNPKQYRYIECKPTAPPIKGHLHKRVQTVKYLKSVYYKVRKTRTSRPRYINNDDGVNIMDLNENDKSVIMEECGSIPQDFSVPGKIHGRKLLFDEFEYIEGKRVPGYLPSSSESDESSLQQISNKPDTENESENLTMVTAHE